MSLLHRVLEPPSYGFQRDGRLYVPTTGEILREFAWRINVFADRKNWLPCFCWTITVLLLVPLYLFLTRYFSWPLAVIGFFYGMTLLGTHGTIWYHRYGTHRAYEFSHAVPRFIVKNLVIKLVPDEIYIVSHYVHHMIPEQPGDPYNAHAGWLYCFLADAIHQPIAKDLSEQEYRRVTQFVDHTGIHINSYAQYRTWGSICHPGWTSLHYTLNWLFWYAAFYLIGGHALATAIFGMAFFWAIGVRTFNYSGHGGGKDRKHPGVDFNAKDLSINQLFPGFMTGEWHNNHHLYPQSARAGFLPHQLDLAWLFIRGCSLIGAVHSYRDDKADFMKKHYRPYMKERETQSHPSPVHSESS